jgi:hypothetical protein
MSRLESHPCRGTASLPFLVCLVSSVHPICLVYLAYLVILFIGHYPKFTGIFNYIINLRISTLYSLLPTLYYLLPTPYSVLCALSSNILDSCLRRNDRGRLTTHYSLRSVSIFPLLVDLCSGVNIIVHMKSWSWTKAVDDRIWNLLQTKYTAWTVIVIGILMRISQYVYNRSLTEGEAPLALNIIERSFSQLLKPLDYVQAAPVGFLIMEKLITQIMGTSEYGLRLFPLLAGIAAMPLFYVLTRRICTRSTTFIALVLFAVGDHLIYFASEVKQYSTDVFFTIAVLLVTLIVLKHNNRPVFILLFGFIGAIAIWFSHPAFFVLAGSWCVVLIVCIKKQQWRACAWFFIATILVTGSLSIDYLVSLRYMSAHQELTSFWQHAFMPMPPKSFSDLFWYPYVFLRTFKFPLGLSMYELLLAVLAFFIGCAVLLNKRKSYLALLGFPILITLIASSLRLYPFEGRLILFLTPLMLIIIAVGIEFLRKTAAIGKPLVGTALVAVLCIQPIVNAGYRCIKPRAPEELRPALEYITTNFQDGDILYVYYAAYNAFRYYQPRVGFEGEYVIGVEARTELARYFFDIQQLTHFKRGWFVFSHITNQYGVDEEQLFVAYLNILGEKLDQYRPPGAAVYLYSLE